MSSAGGTVVDGTGAAPVASPTCVYATGVIVEVGRRSRSTVTPSSTPAAQW